ncbi:MAG: metalloregulator ArsR/SmtB family transcription factor [Desulfobulbaceae bacterium]
MEQEVRFFKALAEPVRLRILALLLHGERCVCELMDVLDMPQSTVSRHLAYLRNAGLIVGRRNGVWMYYRLAEPGAPLLEDLFALLETHLPKMGRIETDLQTLARQKAAGGSGRC